MDELKSAFTNIKTPESSMFKLLQGFSMERSIDGSTLSISTSNKSEQIIVLNILSTINRQIKTEDYNNYITPHSVVITSANSLLKKMALYGIETKLDSNEIVNYLVSVFNKGSKVKYEFSHADQVHFLRIERLKSEQLNELIKLFGNINIEIGMKQIYGSKDGFAIEGEDAKRIAGRLADRNLNFEGRRFIPSLGSSLSL